MDSMKFHACLHIYFISIYIWSGEKFDLHCWLKVLVYGDFNGDKYMNKE